jgi:hypothetical protein
MMREEPAPRSQKCPLKVVVVAVEMLCHPPPNLPGRPSDRPMHFMPVSKSSNSSTPPVAAELQKDVAPV